MRTTPPSKLSERTALAAVQHSGSLIYSGCCRARNAGALRGGLCQRFGVLSKRFRVVHLSLFSALAAVVATCLVRAQPLETTPPPSGAYAGTRVDDLQQQVIELQRDSLV